MTFHTLICRSLSFHWRSHLGVVLGAAIGSAALIGALVVGDSVRESLRRHALQRLGHIEFALQAGDRTFTDGLAAQMPRDLMDSWREDEGDTWVYFNGGPAAALVLPAVAVRPGGDARANQVQVIGVVQQPEAERGNHYYEFWSYANWEEKPVLPAGEVLLNAALAAQLQVNPGDEVILRLQKLAALSQDVAMSPRDENSVSLRLRVSSIVPADHLGDFNLRATATPTLNAFVNLKELQQATHLEGRANVIVSGGIRVDRERLPRKVQELTQPVTGSKVADLVGDQFRTDRTRDSATALLEFQEALEANALLADYETTLRIVPSPSIDLFSKRVFLDPPVVIAASSAQTDCQRILTYLATLLQTGTNATPYSMVTAAGSPWTPADLRDDEIIVSQWLADDLRVKPGDTIALSYFLPESGAKLQEATNVFQVRGIVPMEMPWADPMLMPDFPGIEKAESTSEWDAGFPLTYKVRPQDDEYWKQYRGTPKAFITLAAGQKMWGNRFGNLTAIRFPISTNAPLAPALPPSEGARENRSPSQSEPKSDDNSTRPGTSRDAQLPSPLPRGEGQGEGERQTSQLETPQVFSYKEALEKKILAHLKPEELGLRFEPVREQALKAAAESQDFGGLFLGFSFFLIIAALLLMALLFQFGLEQRAPEIGTLLALGFTPKQVRKLLLREGVALALVGGVIGTIGGLLYARAMLHGLTTIWRDAVGASALNFHFTGQTLVIGLSASVVVSAATIWLALRKFVKRPARELLVGEIGGAESTGQRLRSKLAASGALLVALGLVGFAVATGDTANAGIFFGAGALILVAGLSFASAWLVKLGGAPVSNPAQRVDSPGHAGSETGAPITVMSLAIRGCARRRKRSLGTVAMLACGSFLIVSIGVFRLDANRDATKRTSGTGGFALLGETTIPVVQDLNAESGREFFALNEHDLEGVSFVPLRVKEGDDASCLNLNRAQRPRLLGVKPELLDGRFSFAGMIHGPPRDLKWNLLRSPPEGLQFGSDVPLVPAIGDANSVQWALGKKLGDTIDFTDAQGRPFKVWIVATVANSVLQGNLLIDEAQFVKCFPGESGYQMFLIDAPSNALSQVSASLSRAMQDVGLELTPTAQRLAQFNAVQNTYLGTFQVLGGLGLLLGSVGLGIVVLRNVLERRGELALLMAVGFRKPQVQRLLLMENAALLAAGLALGVAAAAVAVLPALLSPGAQFPVASLTLTLGAVLINGAVWTWVATRLALRGDLLAALRNE